MNQFGLLLKLILGGGIKKFRFEFIKPILYNIYIESENKLKNFNKYALRSRAERVVKSNPKIPDYFKLAVRPGSEDYKKLASVSTTESYTSKKDSMQYTGDQLVGIGTMHKSNAVPITKNSDMAKEIAKMRR